MSNPGNPNGIITNSNNLGTRDGTRVVLREITATLQNSPPMQPGLRKVVNNTQPGKTEHEVKVQFTREFVDAGAPNSRPESLSSASSFQSLASTLSTKSGVQSSPVTPQRAANTSYVNTDIPGLDDLIAACGNIHLNDKLESEEVGTFQSIADSTLTVTASDNSFQLPNTVQNLSQEDSAFVSAINNSNHLNGTHDLTSDYKEAFENSPNLNGTKEAGLDDKFGNSISESVKDLQPKPTEENLIKNHLKDSQDIPQTTVDNSLLHETRDLSLNSYIADGFSLNKTTDSASAPEQLEINSLEAQDCSPSSNSLEAQNCSPSSNSFEIPQPLNQTIETVVNSNSTFNNLNSSKTDVLNLTHDVSNDKNLSIDYSSQNTTDTRSNQSTNELSATEAEGNVSSLNDPLNLPPESDADISTSNLQIDTSDGIVTESFSIDELSNKESNLAIERAIQQKSVEIFGDQSVQKVPILTDQCIPDSSTDDLAEIIPEYTNRAETATSSIIVPEIYKNISADFLKESIAQEEAQQISDSHNVSTTATVLEVKIDAEENSNELERVQSQEISETENKVLNSTIIDFDKSKELPCETPVDQLPKTSEKAESIEIVLPVPENIVPCGPTQDSLKHFQELGESKSRELPEISINVTPFPGYIPESYQNCTLTVKEGSPNQSSSVDQDSNHTVTIKEESFHSIGSEGASETYTAFQPEKQSTSLNLDCNFTKLELAAQGIAEEIHNKSLEFTEDSDQFFNAESDIFLDTASLDFFLTRNNSKNSIRDLRSESLYVKFDPLVSNVRMLPQGPPQVVDGEENAKNSMPQPTLDTPKRNPALAAIDRLLFYSPATGTPNKVEEPPKIEEKIVQDVKPEPVPIVDETMAKELELVRSTVLQLDSQLEKQRKEHEEELEKERLKYKELELELAREVQKKNEMTMVMDEYEKSLSRHMADRERERASFEQERAKLQEELQAANHHLGNTEAAFNDVHSKYERVKNVVSAYKSNEEILKESVHENVETIKTLEARYEQLKSHAMTQLEKANLELEAIRKQHETETVRLQAMIRKAELKSNSLAEMVEQKSKENKELAEILDEVIARVGRQPE